MKTLLTITSMLIGLISTAQELTCKDFKTGKFYMPVIANESEYQVQNKDSMKNASLENTAEAEKYIVVIREENTQIEWENGKPDYEVIEWIDDCTYRLTYDESKYEIGAEKNG